MPGPRRPSPQSDLPRCLYVDSGGWIALLSARDQHHLEADRLFRLAASHEIPLFTSNLVLAEVHRLLLYRAGARAAAVSLRRVLSSNLVRLKCATPAHHEAGLEWLERLSQQGVTYTDAVSFAVMESNQCLKAISFDRHFSLAGFVLWRLI